MEGRREVGGGGEERRKGGMRVRRKEVREGGREG